MNTPVMVCCAICAGDIRRSEFDARLVADAKVLDCYGDLDFIELAHYHCARKENKRFGAPVWEMGVAA